MAGDHAIGGDIVFGHIKICGAMVDEHVDLAEGTRIEEHVDALAGGEFTRLVLLFDARFAAHLFRLADSYFQQFDFLFYRTHSNLLS